MIVYIASCVPDGGIYRAALDDAGSLTILDKTPMDRPMYMAIEDHKLYVVLRAPAETAPDSGVQVWDILPDGSLANPSGIMSTHGKVACHILVEEGTVWCANYISGSVVRLPDTLAVHAGSGPNAARQEGPHVHYVGLTPDGKYLCAVDLGVDTIFVYDRALNPVSRARVPAGHGARHLVFSPDGRRAYCANELGSTVTVFAYSDGVFKPIETVSTVPADFTGDNFPAAIRLRDGRLYVSNRGHDSVAVMEAGERLRLIETVPCGGCWPRDMTLAGDFMLIANERSGDVCVRTREAVTARVEIPTPLCIITQEV